MGRDKDPALFAVPDLGGERLYDKLDKFVRTDANSRAMSSVRNYADVLVRDSSEMQNAIRDHMESFHTTNNILEAYHNTGGTLEGLIVKIVEHLNSLLTTPSNQDDADGSLQLGNLHFQWGIEPLWILGTYNTYVHVLQEQIRTSHEIPDGERNILEDGIRALVLRDMGLFVQGYWEANRATISRERDRTVRLQEDITRLLGNIPLMVWAVGIERTGSDFQFNPIYLSPSALSGWSLDSELPVPFAHKLLDKDQQHLQAAWREALRGKTIEQEVRFGTQDESSQWMRITLHPSENDEGTVVRIDGVLADISEEKAAIKRLETMATTDSLTCLPNRTLFNDRLNLAIEGARRDSSRQVVLMLIDLNRFKEINDTLGHPAGDAVLKMVADRLRPVMRASDTLARLGGDEFAIVLSNAQDGELAGNTVARLLLEKLDSPIEVSGNDLFVGASIGIAIFPDHGDTDELLLSRADVAMYSVKGTGSSYAFYSSVMDPTAKQHLQLTSDLRRVVERNQLSAVYQPIVDMRSGKILSFEALSRWNHPQLGQLNPAEFIPLAEKSGVIAEISEWITETSLEYLQQWRSLLPDLTVAVNMSGRALQDRGFFQWLERTLKDFPAPQGALEIEITENVLMSDVEHVAGIMRRLTNDGVKVAIDDFGTGYSSLSYLRSLPIQTIKVDRSFVHDMMNDENAAIIVKAVIDMAKNLGYGIIAEGIETKETMEILVVLGCERGQGFYFGRPIPGDEVSAWLQETQGDLSDLM